LSQEYPQIAHALRKFCQDRMLANVMQFSPVFKPFEKPERDALIAKFTSKDVGPGHKVIQEGIPADGLYIILSGQVDVTKEGKVLAHLREGEIFGEMSLLTKTAATATVKSSKPT
jgi:CRP-like cAMP-binding protein